MKSTRNISGRILLATCCALGLAACGKTFVQEELPNTFELSSGTKINVRLVDPLPAAGVPVGQNFAATLAEPLYYVRTRLDQTGQTFTEETLIAPIGAPVFGETVDLPDGGDTSGVGLRLDSITVHGGMSFPVKTTVVAIPTDEEGAATEQTAESGGPLMFELAEPADVAMVIDYRDQMKEEEVN